MFFIEEPVERRDGPGVLELHPAEGVVVVQPVVSPDDDRDQRVATQRAVVDALLARWQVERFVSWYYTPMALEFTAHLRPVATVFDCMDQLSAFRGAHPLLAPLERELLALADVVFTGGASLHELKRSMHRNVHLFPSSVDAAHYARARASQPEPADQAGIPGPRMGYAGVIDERMDFDLITAVADARPDWQIVLVGPTAKLDQSELPCRPNLHYLGPKAYEDLPTYMSGWSVALIPFALNESTRYLSPTKTPEYLAAGLPVVSTPIQDVVQPYGQLGLCRIASSADGFVAAAQAAMKEDAATRLATVDQMLARQSWDNTWAGMRQLLDQAVAGRTLQFAGAPLRLDSISVSAAS